MVLNSFFSKKFSRFAIFFFLSFPFFKKLENERMDCGLRNGGVSHFLCFSFGASERLRGGVGRRLPVNIWTWAGSGAGAGRSRGSQAEEIRAPQTRIWMFPSRVTGQDKG